MSEQQRISRCLCGAVELKLVGEPIIMGLCHCESCTRWLSAPVHASALWSSDNVEVTKGEEFLRTFKRTPETGSHRKFCSECGSGVLIDHPTVNFTDIPAVSVVDLEFETHAHTLFAQGNFYP